MSGLPSSAWTTSTSALVSGRMSSLDEGLAVGVLDEVLDGLVEDGAGAEVPLEDRARRLARAEARDARPARRGGGRRRRWRGSRRSAGTSISSSIVEFGPGVLVICIAREV